MKRILIASALVCITMGMPMAGQGQVSPFAREGKEYFVVSGSERRSAWSPEVVEFFSYGCSHCDEYQPYMEELLDRVPSGTTVRYVPVVLNPAWEPYSRAFFAAEALGVLPQTHAKLFRAIAERQVPLHTVEELATNFYKRFGVEPARFVQVANSDLVTQKLIAAYQLAVAYGVDRTPTLVVDQRYRVVIDESVGVSAERTVELAVSLRR